MLTTRLRFLTAGESHGPELITILEGMAAGLTLSSRIIDSELQRRQRGYGSGPRMKIESDHAEILSGVMGGTTIGSPIAMRIQNKNHDRWRGEQIEPFTTPRPGHADLTGAIKYGYQDLRPSLERASARETAARVAVGAVCKHFLAQFGVQVFGYVTSIGTITADLNNIPIEDRGDQAEKSDVRCPDPQTAELMRVEIRKTIEAKDTLGGIIETVALNLPPGLGSHVHWDRRLNTRLGAAVLSIQAIKGVEFGTAFENTRRPGTQVHDGIRLVGSDLVRTSNHAGGIEGGISNGQPVIIRAAMKPIATTLTPQKSVDLASGQETDTVYERSDFCPVPRAVPIIEAMVAFILADALLEKLGGDSMDEIQPRFEALRKTRLNDLKMSGSPHVWWSDE